MDWSYVAGFIDGEGTITFARCRTRVGNPSLKPRIIVGQKKPEVLYLIQEKVGGGHVLQQPGGLFVWQADGLRLHLDLMSRLQPLLIIKKRQAEILVEFCKCRLAVLGGNQTYDQHCLDLDIEMRALNLRGQPEARRT